jgi:hypothetical protein
MFIYLKKRSKKRMRITYQNGRLYISLTKNEVKDVQENLGKPCEIDIGNIKVLHEDINEVVKQRLKELEL